MMYLVKMLRLDPLENSASAAAYYETVGVTRDPAVRVFLEQEAGEVDPKSCWVLASEITWPRPIKRCVLVPIAVIGTVSQAEELLRR